MTRTEMWAFRIFALLMLLMAATVPGVASAADIPTTTQAMPAVSPTDFRGDVRDLPLIVAPPQPYRGRPATTAPGLVSGSGATSAAPLAPMAAPLGPMPATTQNFAGLSFGDLCGGVQCGGGWPAISNGAAGLNHYVHAVNFAYAIYSKTGTLLASFTENQLFAATSGSTSCSTTNWGDAIVLYDQLANRFILSNLSFGLDAGGFPTSPFYQCIAVSKTSDPVSGGWWLYALRMDPGGAGMPPVGALNDYGKFGLWTDCLYLGTNEYQMPGGSFFGTFIGNVFASFSRSDLYSGAALTWSMIYVAGGDQRFLPIPANMSGTQPSTQPPAGRPAFFVAQGPSSFQVRTFTAGPNCGAGGTLSAPVDVSQAAVGGYTVPAGNIVPQPGTANLLDALDDRMMQKVQYRRVGSSESQWVVHNVQTTVGADTTVKPHWAQIDVTGGTIAPTPVQQQIYAPDTTLNRWFGSLAVDGQGNMALGYSTSNGVVPNYPSIAYAGRLAGDPLNSLPQSEAQLVAGAASQTNNCGGGPCHRWGDYSGMSIDPIDDCTFWYTNQYYSSTANGSSGNWQTHIGAFAFPSCVAAATPTLSASPSSVAAGSSVTATWSGIPSPTNTDWIGLYLPGAANTAYLAWMYVSCSHTAGSAMAAGSCALSIPGGLTPGTYQLRLLSNNGFTVLATSNDFTVTAAGPTLSASPGSVVAGSSVTATWNGIPSPTTIDWIGLYTPGAANTAYLAWIYVSCSHTPGSAMAAGSCAFPIPGGLAPGTYQLRLLSNNGFTLLATSNDFTVTAAGPALTMAPASVPAGGSVTATWSGIASPTNTDWIGLYAQGSADTAYLAWIYVSCSHTPGAAAAAGSCAFTIPSGVTPGTYELRLLANNGFTRLATSGALTVTTAGPGLSASPPTVMHGASVTATWSAIPSPTTTDWIGLYAPGAANTAYIAWVYVSCTQTPGAAAAAGSCPFTIPGTLTPGTYELRLFTNNGYARLATSNPLTVQ